MRWQVPVFRPQMRRRNLTMLYCPQEVNMSCGKRYPNEAPAPERKDPPKPVLPVPERKREPVPA